MVFAKTPDTSADTSQAPEPPAAFSLQIHGLSKDLEELLLAHLELQRFRNMVGLQADEILRLASAAEADARQLLATQGYFAPQIQVSLNRQEHRQPPQQPPYHIQLDITPGTPTQVAQVHLNLTDTHTAPLQRREQQLQRNWQLPAGQPFSQSAWDSAKDHALRQLQTRRYPTARIASSHADIDPGSAQAQLHVSYAPGPAYRFGPLHIQGAQRYDAQGTARIARLPSGGDYNETQLLDAQQRLAASGYYDSVFLQLDTSSAIDDDSITAPVIAQVREAKQHKWVIGLGLSTDSGPRLSLDHTNNRLPWLGWRAQTKLSLERDLKLLSTQWTALPQSNGWRWFSGAQIQREATGSYQINSGQLRWGQSKASDHIDRSLFVQYDNAHNQGSGAPDNSSAISANYAWTGRYFNNQQSPTRGWGLAAELGLGHTLEPQIKPFSRSLLRWQGFYPLGLVQLDDKTRRRARLALRLEGGAVLAAKHTTLPITQLFLTGGDTSVRGYGYRSIGARQQGGQLYGGRYLALASLEWQRPISLRGNLRDFESAVFIDAASIGNARQHLTHRVGIGAGLRWRSPVGPLQTDIAYGLQSQQFRLHLRLGYQF